MKRAFQRQVGDGFVTIVLDTADLEADDNLYLEASRIASAMGLVADLMAEATAAVGVAEGALKATRGQVLADLPDDLSQWRAEKKIDADERVMRQVCVVAKAESDLSFLKTYHDALRYQSSTIRARVELLKMQWDATSTAVDDEIDRPPVQNRARPAYRKVKGGETDALKSLDDKLRDLKKGKK